jgi:FlgN protein
LTGDSKRRVSGSAAVSASPTVGENVVRLTDALRSEKRLIDELIAITRRQRAALASEDLQAVGDSAHAIQRVLFTLTEARRRRRAINRMLGGSDDLALRDLEDTLGNSMTDSVRAARDELDGAALLLSDEVRINRSVLRETLA